MAVPWAWGRTLKGLIRQHPSTVRPAQWATGRFVAGQILAARPDNGYGTWLAANLRHR